MIDPVADARAAYLAAVMATGLTEEEAWHEIRHNALEAADAIDAAWVAKHFPPSPDVIGKR